MKRVWILLSGVKQSLQRYHGVSVLVPYICLFEWFTAGDIDGHDFSFNSFSNTESMGDDVVCMSRKQ